MQDGSKAESIAGCFCAFTRKARQQNKNIGGKITFESDFKDFYLRSTVEIRLGNWNIHSLNSLVRPFQRSDESLCGVAKEKIW